MGMLKHVGSSSLSLLGAETTVGRSARCELLLCNGLVSAMHACIRWSRMGWELRDLGSTNGTFLNGVRLRGAETRALALGDFISFGAIENRYEVVDVGAPVLSAACEDGTVVRADGPLLVLPSAETPLVTIYRNAEGAWQVEGTAAQGTVLGPDCKFRALGKAWELLVPEGVARTEGAEGMDIRQSGIRFVVSPDEEYVQMVLHNGTGEFPIENRASNYLLLTLARGRLRDLEAGVAEDDAGWVLLEELARSLATTPEHVNVDVYRARRRLGQIFCNAAEIIERRAGTGQLRIGVRDIGILKLTPKARNGKSVRVSPR